MPQNQNTLSLSPTRVTEVTYVGPNDRSVDRNTMDDLLAKIGNLKEVFISGFMTVKAVRKYYKCNNCHSELPVPAVVLPFIICNACNDMNNVAFLGEAHIATEVKFLDGGRATTASIDADELEDVLDLSSASDSIRRSLIEFTNMQPMYHPKAGVTTSLGICYHRFFEPFSSSSIGHGFLGKTLNSLTF